MNQKEAFVLLKDIKEDVVPLLRFDRERSDKAERERLPYSLYPHHPRISTVDEVEYFVTFFFWEDRPFPVQPRLRFLDLYSWREWERKPYRRVLASGWFSVRYGDLIFNDPPFPYLTMQQIANRFPVTRIDGYRDFCNACMCWEENPACFFTTPQPVYTTPDLCLCQQCLGCLVPTTIKEITR